MITKLSVVFLSLIAVPFLNGCNHAETETHHELPKFEATTPFHKDVSLPRQYVSQIKAIMHIEIRALEKGYLEGIFVDEGQWLKKGQPMFKIMPKIYQAELQRARAEAQTAKIEYLNTKGLADENIVSPNELALAKAKLDKANAEVRFSETRLGFTDIKASFDGVMGHFNARIGSLLDEGELLTELSDIRQLWVYFNVPEADYLNFRMEEGDKLGETVQLKMANGQIYDHTGVIETIVGDFDNTYGTIQFRALFPNPDRILRHGETGTILLTKHYPNAMIIPQKAVFEIMDKNYVYVINEEEKLEQRLIHIEAEMTKLFLISDGLNVSDRVLLEGIRKVNPGDKVSINLRPPEEIVPELELYTE
ncbi:MAG TPA: efflux RND transporter periplasmic adaptor subunit [Nitrosomonas mobilis]|nr:efflux RND transporter periplasmic adaptor subunit [Nitrosomonas mobilis]